MDDQQNNKIRSSKSKKKMMYLLPPWWTLMIDDGIFEMEGLCAWHLARVGVEVGWIGEEEWRFFGLDDRYI